MNKTGTTTLGRCGQILGYRCATCDGELLKDVVLKKDLSRVEAAAGQNDFFEDWPWPLIYKEMDAKFPDSKFILTVRKDENAWLESLKKHSMRTHPAKHYRKLVYGHNFPHDHEQEHLEFYRRHNDAVRDYFAGRDGDFIELCWENGDDWEKLCAFLGAGVPDVDFPHANRGSDEPPRTKRNFLNRVSRFLDK